MQCTPSSPARYAFVRIHDEHRIERGTSTPMAVLAPIASLYRCLYIYILVHIRPCISVHAIE